MKQTTYDTASTVQDRAVLVSLITQVMKRSDTNHDLSLQELAKLAETAQVEVVSTVTQNRVSRDAKWFIGKGKVEELKAVIDELDANTAIFDQELSGAQVRNLEQVLNVKIIDRTQLILDIFAQRAKTREGIIQVELAQLSYILPRLSGHGKNLSRLGGGIGTRGPGESKLETDRRHIRGRISELKRQLEEVVRHRSLYRERRRKTGIYQVALVGYTNAGKSTLLNQLTEADVLIEDQLFATLDPTSRTLALPSGKEIVITDTVGFIQNLPHDLVAAFRATLEEVCEADLILHVVDSSSEMRDDQMRVVDEILQELGAAAKPQVLLYNKIDACTPSQREMLPSGPQVLKISAYNLADQERIRELIQQHVVGDTRTFCVPADRGEIISLLYRTGDVLEQVVEDEDLWIQVRLNRADYEKQGYLLDPYMQL
ncbi:GTPase HflX [Paenibacillus selenitireducens]|uniref:GTPase HflX n=1 Tax=Paenibacillus selenitireducens TaxID=1324314 RepID=A0A1T2X539_9BACL|nr:GTPase HflX [Paenibacillus selenitireducens]OPA74693.1 GTPase HflX [Paenibacillus selenitireducens]